MINYLVVLFLLITVSIGCKSGKDSSQTKKKEMPTWLENTIEKNNFEEISSYLFKGDTVFLLVPPCCDRFTELYNQSGDLICHPSGGITGRGDGTCPEFRQEASQLKTFVKNYSKVDE